MKAKVTQKSIKSSFNIILNVGNCTLQRLLSYHSPFAYSAGVYGWNCDYYEINGVCIVSGYRGHGKNVVAIARKYEDKANNMAFNEKEFDKLLNEFINEATNS